MAEGSYTFKWSHPGANEVFVTGDFDDWQKSVQLEKKGESFEKTVKLPVDKKVLYKFVVDGSWKTDETKPTETDSQNIANNVLHPKDILPAAVSSTISTVTPNATTVGMAGQVPKETPKSEVPGAFIETPANERGDAFSVNPIPATSGIGNPIKLAPGEKVPDPSTITKNTVGSTVKTDEESYNKPDAGVALGNDKDFSVPPIQKGMIPESSLPMGQGGEGASPFISSQGGNTTTSALAGQVPLEPKGVPEVVSESQQKADVGPEAAANPEAVSEKKDVEKELKDKVKEVPAAASGTGSAVKGKGKGKERETADAVPAVVSESLKEAHQSPEAAANPEAVEEKKEVEQELAKKVNKTDQAGEPAPTATAATSSTAPGTGSAAKSDAAKTEDKKKKRRSAFINRIKQVLKPSSSSK